ncbi:MAG: prepilin-type N-terminal cleavage/methylation domain-containing protein [Pirellulaceae bacterium]|nr:prepilin-type N-terminal cleavage/methylation domain-containing protein [Pirellulaceae bacterium]
MNPLATSSKKIHPLRFVKRRSRQGLTLVELLIAVSLTLIIVAAMIRAFKSTGDSISLGRAKMDMHNKIRVVTETLRRDLQNATHAPNPRAGNSAGYFEIIEGLETDAVHATSDISFLGDHDDILALTVKSKGEPFRGRFNGVWVESYLAEVIWWVVHDDTDGSDEAGYDESLRLYRRVLLIRPDLVTLAVDLDTFQRDNDVSARYSDDGTGLVMNSLAELANRKNRFAHNPNQFPFEIDDVSAALLPLENDFEGQDLMLDNCVAFDVKVFDPTAEVFTPTAVGNGLGQVVDWDDPGFAGVVAAFPPTSNANAYSQNGAYVNLGYDEAVANDNRWFSNIPFFNNYPLGWNKKTYCTWWEGYERDGFDQDQNGAIDQGIDGIDNNADGIIDDNLEQETQPPYAYPLRSLEVRVRMIEKKSNQILQQTVRESFVPN